MKRVALLALFVLLILFFPAISSAADMNASNSSSMQVVVHPVSYDLPYPGMLPDNPLYFLKEFRDNVVSFLISDPLKKAEFDLLASDKQINSAVYLVKKGESGQISVNAVSKSNDYFSQSIQELNQAKQNGEDINELKSRMQNAIKKHEEVGVGLEVGINSNYKDNLLPEENQMKALSRKLSSL